MLTDERRCAIYSGHRWAHENHNPEGLELKVAGAWIHLWDDRPCSAQHHAQDAPHTHATCLVTAYAVGHISPVVCLQLSATPPEMRVSLAEAIGIVPRSHHAPRVLDLDIPDFRIRCRIVVQALHRGTRPTDLALIGYPVEPVVLR